ncbi:hypothetical protein D3C72_1320360 [compost metagenome]
MRMPTTTMTPRPKAGMAAMAERHRSVPVARGKVSTLRTLKWIATARQTAISPPAKKPPTSSEPTERLVAVARIRNAMLGGMTLSSTEVAAMIAPACAGG